MKTWNGFWVSNMGNFLKILNLIALHAKTQIGRSLVLCSSCNFWSFFLLQFCIGTIKDDFLGVINDPVTSWSNCSANFDGLEVFQLHNASRTVLDYKVTKYAVGRCLFYYWILVVRRVFGTWHCILYDTVVFSIPKLGNCLHFKLFRNITWYSSPWIN